MTQATPLHPLKRHVGGFTLVEVLVALLVMAVMAVMAWQGVDSVVRTRDAGQQRLERTLRLNTVVAQWEQDLAAIQDTTVIPLALSCDGASVRLARRTPTGLQIVAWTLRPDAGGSVGNGTLERWAGPSVTTGGELTDSWLRSLQLQAGEPGQLRTLTGVAQWQVYFYQGNAWSNCQSTGDVQAVSGAASAAATRQALPKGVRLVVTFAPGSGLNGDLVRDVLLGP
ncbi:MAG TPA: prepilin-type N-terminal cleavage/methylation domain-containing protein [Burkholderiaceae bacterium]